MRENNNNNRTKNQRHKKEKDEAEVGEFSDHLVRTSPYRGLGPREVEEALRLLGVSDGL